MMIPQCDPRASYQQYRQEIDAEIENVLLSGKYILADQTSNFEVEFASYVGVKHCVGVANGTDAIVLALKALDIGVGDQVLTVSHTAVATVAAIVQVGAIPVFVDIEEQSFGMDPDHLEEVLKISNNVRAVIAVHLYGGPCSIDKILKICHEHDIPLIEDSSQSHGATVNREKVGSIGVMGTFSFYPTKNLGAIGDGGGIVTNDPLLAEKLIQLRQYGWDKTRETSFFGQNSRLDEMQAAILRVKLKHLDADNQKRQEIASQYSEGLKGHTEYLLPEVVESRQHVFHQYVIRVNNRSQIIKHLDNHGIGHGIHYKLPVHQQGAFRQFFHYPLENTEEICQSILSLPIFPQLDQERVNQVINVLKSI